MIMMMMIFVPFWQMGSKVGVLYKSSIMLTPKSNHKQSDVFDKDGDTIPVM